jgi:shikimate 5-dehydrogenase
MGVGSIAIDGETKLMGVVGKKIAYTMSPQMHNRAAQVLGVNATYLPIDLPRAKVKAFLDAAWHMGAAGFNVTQPHKELVAKLFPAKGLASANTLYRGPRGWRAASTDAQGFARGLERLGRGLDSFERMIVLGSGGVTLAILAHVAAMRGGPREITVLRRDKGRDRALKAAGKGRVARIAALSAKELSTSLKGRGAETLLVQATSAPHRGDDLKRLVPGLDGYQGVVVDLVYGKPSALYFTAVARDLVTQDGEAMLIEQARLSQELWWRRSASYELLAAALRGK